MAALGLRRPCKLPGSPISVPCPLPKSFASFGEKTWFDRHKQALTIEIIGAEPEYSRAPRSLLALADPGGVLVRAGREQGEHQAAQQQRQARRCDAICVGKGSWLVLVQGPSAPGIRKSGSPPLDGMSL